MRVAFKIASVLLLPLFAGTATADPEVAKELQRLGIEKAREQRFDEALTLFRQALAEEVNTDVLCNMANTYFAMKRWPETHAFLTRCLLETPPEENADYYAEMSRFLIEVESKLLAGDFGMLPVELAPDLAKLGTSSLPADVALEGSGALWLPVGEVELVATAEGFATEKTLVMVRKGPNPEVTIELLPSQPPATKTKSETRSAPEPVSSEPLSVEQTPKRDAHQGRMLVAIGSAAVGVGALVAGGYFAFEAKEKRDEQRSMQLPPGDAYDALKRDGNRLQKIGAGFLVGGAAAGLVAAYLCWTVTEENSTSLHVSTNSLSVGSAWSF